LEDRVHYLRPPGPRTVLPLPQQTTQKVALLEASLSADTLLLENILALDYVGLVIGGFGAGHISQRWATMIEHIAERIPVIIATRTGSGSTARASYGFGGSEMDLMRKGGIDGGLSMSAKSQNSALAAAWLPAAARTCAVSQRRHLTSKQCTNLWAEDLR
jgi:L-asparaginase